MTIARLLPLLLLTGCLSAPPFEATGDFGVVHAHRRALAHELRDLADAFVADIECAVPEIERRSATVWVQKEVRSIWGFRPNENVVGYRESLGNRIYLLESSEDLREDLRHELVHATLGSAWSGLAPALEEGLCDQLAFWFGDGSSGKSSNRLLLAAEALDGPRYRVRVEGPNFEFEAPFVLVGPEPVDDPLRVFERSSYDVHPLFGEVASYSLYGLGWFVVGRIFERHGVTEGAERLLAASQQREVDSVPALLAASGLTADVETWKRELHSLLDESASLVIDDNVEPLVDFVLGVVESRPLGLEPEHLQACKFELLVEGVTEVYDLRASARFRAALRIALDERADSSVRSNDTGRAEISTFGAIPCSAPLTRYP